MVTITVLVDNQAEGDLESEHGLAILIEYQGKRILFDTGQNAQALFVNAEMLGVALDNLDIIILSHGHYDHGGNLSLLLEVNSQSIFYAHPDCKQTRYSLHPNKPVKNIALTNETIKAIDALPASRKQFISEATEILPGFWLSGAIPRKSEFEDTGGPFFLDKDGLHADQINDDMSLYIKNDEGLAVICGCCHSGIVNTLTHIQKQIGAALPINTLLGGLHLVNADHERLTHTLAFLNQQDITTIYPAHCTGPEAILRLKKELNHNVQVAKAGLKITL